MRNWLCCAIALVFLVDVCTSSRDPTIAIGEKPIVAKTWCVTKSGLTNDELIRARDKYCNEAGVNCDAIKPGGACFEPNTLDEHASYALDSYYAVHYHMKPFCPDDFGFYSLIDPSHGSCVFP